MSRPVCQHARVLRLQGGEAAPDVNTAGGAITSVSPLPLARNQDATGADALGAVKQGTVSVTFTIQYGLDDGSMVMSGPEDVFGRGELHRAPKMRRLAGDMWELTLELPRSTDVYTYNYIAQAKFSRSEARNAPRTISILGLQAGERMSVKDAFRSSKVATLATAAFDRAIFGRGKHPATISSENLFAKISQVSWDTGVGGRDDQVTVRFVNFVPRIEAGHSVWVTGKASALGGGSLNQALPMLHVGSRVYVAQATVSQSALPLQFRYLHVYVHTRTRTCTCTSGAEYT